MARISDQDIFIKRLTELGGSAPNPKLMTRIGWPEEKFFKIRDQLLDAGRVVKARGRGGVVRLASDGNDGSSEDAAQPVVSPAVSLSAPLAVAPIVTLPQKYPDESSLYEPFAKCLRSGAWVKDKRLDESLVEITARQGRRATGGTWTRPDLTVVSSKRFSYVPGSQFDIWTFELKTMDALDVTGVFEAAAHGRRATRSYVAFHVPETLTPERQDTLERCQAEAERIGVGVITFTEPDEYESWDEIVNARRQDTPFEYLDEFIAEQISEAGKQKLLRWGR